MDGVGEAAKDFILFVANIIGRGLRHSCTSGDVMAFRQGCVSRAHSVVRLAVGRRK